MDEALVVARRIVEGDQLSRTTGFDGWAPLFFRGREGIRKTIGIIGLGEIGSAVARRARAFDMDVLYTGPNRKEKKNEKSVQICRFRYTIKECRFYHYQRCL